MAWTALRLFSNEAVQKGKGVVGKAMQIAEGTPFAPGYKTKGSFETAANLLNEEGIAKTGDMLKDADKAKEVLDSRVSSIAKDRGLEASAVRSALGSSDQMKALKGIGVEGDNASSLASAYQSSMAKDAIAQKRLGESIAAPVMTGVNYATGDGNLLTGAARVGTVAVGARLVSGGSLTRNNRGERDIVGVPFV